MSHIQKSPPQLHQYYAELAHSVKIYLENADLFHDFALLRTIS